MQQIMLETKNKNKNFEMNKNLLKIHPSDDYSLFYAKLINVEEIFIEEKTIVNKIFEKNNIKAKYKLKFQYKNGDTYHYMSDVKPTLNDMNYYCTLKDNCIIDIYNDKKEFLENIDKYISTTQYYSEFLTKKSSIVQRIRDDVNNNAIALFVFLLPFSIAFSIAYSNMWINAPFLLGYVFFIMGINNIADNNYNNCKSKINEIIFELESQ
ncbi:hypothetical protein ACTOJ1_001740 [Shigella flexneri]